MLAEVSTVALRATQAPPANGVTRIAPTSPKVTPSFRVSSEQSERSTQGSGPQLVGLQGLSRKRLLQQICDFRQYSGIASS
jgi:hypothetical protein